MTVRILVRDHELQAWARRQPAQAERALQDHLTQAGGIVRDHVRLAARASFKRPKGLLAASVRATRTGRYTVRIGPHVPYADAVNYGSRPHIIRARNAGALRFSVGGVTLLRKSVRHPGFKGYRFIERAARTARPVLSANLRKILARRMR